MASLQRFLAEEKLKELRPESACNLSDVPCFLFPGYFETFNLRTIVAIEFKHSYRSYTFEVLSRLT